MENFFEIACGIVRADAERLRANPPAQPKISYCAWCRSVCLDHVPVRKLTDEEYRKVESHGICLECKRGLQP